MICEIKPDKLLLYFFNELPENERPDMARHVIECVSCRQAMAKWRQDVTFYTNLPELSPPLLRVLPPQNISGIAALRMGRPIRRLGFALLLIVIAVVTSRFFRNDAMAFWSLKNSWETPDAQTLEHITRTITQIENDPFFE
jgi:hypothetical protein